jgi:hypothetical protein
VFSVRCQTHNRTELLSTGSILSVDHTSAGQMPATGAPAGASGGSSKAAMCTQRRGGGAAPDDKS